MALPNPFAWHTASAICFPGLSSTVPFLYCAPGMAAVYIWALSPLGCRSLKNMLTFAEQILAASASLGSDQRRLHRFRPLGPWPRRKQPEVKDGGHWVTEASDADIR